MTNQEIEETQEIDEEVTTSGNTEIDTNEDGEDDNNEASTKKSNNSNFKALYKSNKENKALLAEQAEQLAEAEEELRQWRELNPETVEELSSKKDIDSMKEEIFTTKNPEAEPHLKEIRKTMLEYNMDLKTAWKFVQMDMPEESKTKKDFSIGKTTLTKNSDFTKINPADALKLSKEDQSKWRAAN
jgi:hypothetical protein